MRSSGTAARSGTGSPRCLSSSPHPGGPMASAGPDVPRGPRQPVPSTDTERPPRRQIQTRPDAARYQDRRNHFPAHVAGPIERQYPHPDSIIAASGHSRRARAMH